MTIANIAIKKDKKQGINHYLLVFPEGTIFNNSIFSSRDSSILAKRIGLERKEQNFRNGMVQVASTIFWKIGLAQVGKDASEKEANENAEDLF